MPLSCWTINTLISIAEDAMGTALTARRIMDTDMAAGTMDMVISMGVNSAEIKETAVSETGLKCFS